MELRPSAVGHPPVHHRRRSVSVGVRSRHVEDAEVRSGRQLHVRLGHVGRFPRRLLGRARAQRRPAGQLLRRRSRQRARAEVSPAGRREPGVPRRQAPKLNRESGNLVIGESGNRVIELPQLINSISRSPNPITRSPDSPITRFLYCLFFLSGISGLIYQVVWVRVFGNVFGNTVYSTSLVIAIFMLGLGVGSVVAGAWADRRYAEQGQSLLRAYGYFELLIGVLGLGISALLPHLGQVST